MAARGDSGAPLGASGSLQPSRMGGEYGKRAGSALVLAALALGATFAGWWTFVALTVVLSLLLSWEWGRLVRGRAFDIEFWVQAVALAGAAAGLAVGQGLLSVLVLLVGAVIVAVRRLGSGDLMSPAGVLYVGLPMLGLCWLRSDAAFGLNAVLLAFAVVWTTDTAAFLSGRAIGGPKLWPSISPKKTWAGCVGGAVAAAVAGWVFGAVTGTGGSLALAVLAGLLSVVSQVGDLAESALKRRYGRKDMSGLIPGHGGVFDRLDGMLAVGLACGLIALVRDPFSPGRALLVW